MSERDHQEREVARNYEAFTRMLPDLLADHAGEFALMRDGRVIAFHPDLRRAHIDGAARFEDGLFSIQPVTDEVVRLGCLSHVAFDGDV